MTNGIHQTTLADCDLSLLPPMKVTPEVFFARIPLKYQVKVFRALTIAGGKANAIHAKCLECSNYQRSEITRCGVNTCALWLHRPYQNAEIEPEQEQFT